jgi:hypothetical protein
MVITHSISIHTRPTKTIVPGLNKKDYPRFVGTQGSDEHRRYLLKRGVYQNPFDIGDEVIYRKTRLWVTDIFDDEQIVSWVGLSPKFIELCDPSGEYHYVNPGDIKKARKK